MKHHKIPSTKRHRKLKVVSASNWSEDEEEDNQQPKRNGFISGNPTKLRTKDIKSKRAIEKNKFNQVAPKRVKELFEAAVVSKRKNKNKFKPNQSEPGLLSQLNELGSSSEDETVSRPVEDEDGAERGVKLRPEKVKQGPYESDQQFLRRLNKLANSAKFETLIEERFDVDLCPKIPGLPRKPQVLSTVDGSVYDEAKEKKRIKKSGQDVEAAVPNKIIKRRLRDQKRKMKKKGIKRPPTSDHMEFDDYVDNVHFGEVADRPPSLAKFKRIKRNV